MKRTFLVGGVAALMGLATVAQAEILAMLNYETAPEDSLKALNLQAGPMARREGIAIIDIDPESETYGKWLMDIPLPPDLIAHHIFMNQDATKGYMTALGQSALHVIDFTKFPYRVKRVETPTCKVQEDVIFSKDNKTWYLTCMGSGNIVIGDAVNDTVSRTVDMPKPYPHGIGYSEDIDRLLVTDTVAPDLSAVGESVVEVEASTGRIVAVHRMADSDEPSNAAPVEILFVPGANPPVAYVTNMMNDTLWKGVWNADKGQFDFSQAFDFGAIGSKMPLEMYFNKAVDRFYITTANPGHFHIFDVSENVAEPKLLKTLPAANGAHHVVMPPDESLAFVQNSLLNLPGLSDGSITVIDLRTEQVIDSINTLKERGFNPNMIVMLPEWHHPMGH